MADRRSHLIFISYRGSDQNWATELVYARMTEAFGVNVVFKAGNSLWAGEEFPATLRSEAASCPVMLACIGPGWLTATAPDGSRRLDSPNDWVREEIAISLRSGNHLVPLLLGNRNEVEVPKPDLVPESIRAMVHRQALWLAPGRGLEVTVPMLVDQLAELVPELAERRRGRSTALPASAAQAPGDEGPRTESSLLSRTSTTSTTTTAGECRGAGHQKRPPIAPAVPGAKMSTAEQELSEPPGLRAFLTEPDHGLDAEADAAPLAEQTFYLDPELRGDRSRFVTRRRCAVQPSGALPGTRRGPRTHGATPRGDRQLRLELVKFTFTVLELPHGSSL